MRAMRYLFLHQNAPGQFKHLAPRLAADPANEVVFLHRPGRGPLPGVRMIPYKAHREVSKNVHPYLRYTEEAALNAQGVARVAIELQKQGFEPDVIVAHPGWGESMLMREIFPRARLVHFCEYYYRTSGADVGFDPEFPSSLDSRLALTFRNGHHLLAAEMADACYAPTRWQRSRFPELVQGKIDVIFDGIDVETVAPDPQAMLLLPGIGAFSAGQPTVTYVSRSLEPYRGFHSFARMLPHLFARVPQARVLVVGGDGVSYSPKAPEGKTWREVFTDGLEFPRDRVHFLGRVPYETYLRLLQVSAAHVYLTYPFVLSWSCIEAMSAGCLVVGSRTAPVEEAITDGETGLLADFFDPEGIAETVAGALTRPDDYRGIREAARQSVLDRYELEDCIRRQLALIHGP
jgi:glycosyltransferase involved in cell wall biosynthesis